MFISNEFKNFFFFFQDNSTSSSEDEEEASSEPGIEPLNFNTHRTVTNPIPVPEHNNNNNPETATQDLQTATLATILTESESEIFPGQKDEEDKEHLEEKQTGTGVSEANVQPTPQCANSKSTGGTDSIPKPADIL
jgi:hypothetical protein